MTPRTGGLRAGAAVLGGLLLGLSFWPGRSGWLCWVGFIPLLWALRGEEPAPSFLLGWLCGTCGWAVGTYWLAPPIADFFKVGAAPALLLFLGICAYHGLMVAVPAWLARILAPEGGRVPAFVCAMTASEAFFPLILPITFSYTQYFRLQAVQSVELLGPAGLTLLVFSVNGALYRWLGDARRWKTLVLAALAFAANESYGTWRLRRVEAETARRIAEEPLKVALIQPGFPIGLSSLALQKSLTRSAADGAGEGLGIVVWPEATLGRKLRYRLGADGTPEDPIIAGTPLKDFLLREVAAPAPILLNTRPSVEEGTGEPRTYNVSFLADGTG